MKITFADKVSTIISSLPIINRIRAEDVNEIKTVVNANADDLEEVQELFQLESNTEQVIGKWDNKPLYRKIITGTLPSTTRTNKTLDTISNLGKILTLTATIGYTSTRNQFWAYPFPVITSDTYSSILVNGNNQIIVRWESNASAWVNSPIVVVIEYTKTTD